MQTQANNGGGTLIADLISPIGWLGACLVVAVIGCSQAMDIADNSGEWPTAEHLSQTQKQEAVQARRDRAAQAMCTADHGPQALARWVNTTTAECVNSRGRLLSRQPQEQAHAHR
ncbi:MAG: hypothetical protein LCH79_16485 [Proteobacteria bacterium]|nr:hypothetical protein [Pseudomonadota bacterium]